MPQKILSKTRSYNLDKISLLTTLYINLLILKNKDAKIAIHRLPMIKEAGEVEEKIVAQELFAEVRTQARILSSVEGVRQMIRIPFSILRNLAARTKINDLSNTETRKETLKNEEI